MVLFVGFGLLSMVVVNDALVLVGVPVLVALARRAELPPRPLLLTLAFAVTVGSVATPIGNPQNLLIAASSGSPAPFEEFLRYLLAPVLVTLLAGSLFLRWALRRESASPGDRFQQVRDAAPPLFLPGDWWAAPAAPCPVGVPGDPGGDDRRRYRVGGRRGSVGPALRSPPGLGGPRAGRVEGST